MNAAERPDLDPDNYFSETRMSFGDHIEELRGHLLKAIYGFLICLAGSFFFGWYVVQLMIAPVESELQAFYDRRAKHVADNLKTDENYKVLNKPTEFVQTEFDRRQLLMLLDPKVPIEDINQFSQPSTDTNDIAKMWTRPSEPLKQAILMQKVQQVLGRRPSLSSLRLEEPFMVFFKVSMLTAFVIGSPWIFYQIWSFIAAGLYPHEKRYVNLYLPFSIVLFLGGVAVCQFLVLPKAIEALLWFNEWLGIEPELRLNDWLSFALFMPLVFGLSFQTPLVMMFLERMGIVSIEVFARNRRTAWFVLVVFAAVITPSVDAFSMLFLWVPLVLLYELGIFLCRLSPTERIPLEDEESYESKELIEV